jgi:uncharacterized protein (TIGR02444 family)
MPATDNASPLWRFSLGFYRMPGVAEACIRLQDEAGVDVNLLLYLLWLATSGRRVSGDEVEAVERKIARWREQVVKPLRALRRAIKAPPPVIEPTTAEVFRTRVKNLELEAERLQQEALYVLAQAAACGRPASSPEAAAHANIAGYQAILPRPFPQDALATVMAAFANRSQAG